MDKLERGEKTAERLGKGKEKKIEAKWKSERNRDTRSPINFQVEFLTAFAVASQMNLMKMKFLQNKYTLNEKFVLLCKALINS